MKPKNKKPPISLRRRRLRTYFILLSLLGAFLGGFYLSLHTELGFRWTWGRLISFIPGDLNWDRLDLQLLRGTLHIEGLRYTSPQGQQTIQVDRIDAGLKLSSLIRMRAMIKDLKIENVQIDLSKLPPKKGPSKVAKVLRQIAQRLAIEKGEINNLSFQLKNGSFQTPEIKLSYWPRIFGKDTLSLEISPIEGEILNRPVHVDRVRYDGNFALPNALSQLVFKEATGMLTVENIQIATWSLPKISTEALLEEDAIDLKDFTFSLGKSALHLKLKVAPFGQEAKGELSSVGLIDPNEIPVAGPKIGRAFEKMEFNLPFEISGFTFSEMEGKAEFHGRSVGNVANTEVPNHTVNLVSKIHQGRIHLDQFFLKNDKGQTTGQGYVDLKDMAIDTRFSGNGFDLRTLMAMISTLEIYGLVDFTGTIKGPLKSPDFHFEGLAKKTGYKFLRFGEMTGVFDIKNGQMQYLGHPSTGSEFTGSADIRVTDIFKKETRRAKLNTVFNKLDVGVLLENPDAKGKIDGSFEMESFQKTNSGKIKAHVDDFRFFSFRFGEVSGEGSLLNNVFQIPTIFFHPPGMEVQKIHQGPVFRVDENGMDMKGAPIEGMEVEGSYRYAQKNVFRGKARCRHCSTQPLLAVLEYPPMEGFLDAEGSGDIIIGNFEASKMDFAISRLKMLVGEGELSESGALKIHYAQGAYHFDQVSLKLNGESFRIQGSYASEKPMDLKVLGRVDLALLEEWKAYFLNAEGPASLDLRVQGKYEDPTITGQIRFEGNALRLRAFPNTIENLRGNLILDQQKISSNRLQGSISDGDLIISGAVWHDHFTLKKSDLKIEMKEISYAEPGIYKMYLSGKLALTGEDPNLLLAGNVDITEGRYTKNFEIRDYLITPAPAVPSIDRGNFLSHMRLDLRIQSPGELMVKNNIAELYLKSDLHVTGTKEKPAFQGAIEVLDGKIHYFKINFENAKGYVDFRDPARGGPYIDVAGEKLFERLTEDIQVNAHVTGFTDNLQLSFNSNPPLEKREVLALLLTGALPEESRQISGANIASSVLASQFTSVFEGPVTGFTHLDVFRLEASDPDSKSLTSLVVGKKITERLSLEFRTDLSIDESVRSVQAEYLLFDDLLFKAARSSNGRYRLDLTFRFKSY